MSSRVLLIRSIIRQNELQHCIHMHISLQLELTSNVP